MKGIFGTAVVLLLSVGLLPAQKRLTADTLSTVIDWRGSKIVGSEHSGTVDIRSGWLTMEGDRITGGEFIVDMSSIKDNDLKDEKMREKLVGHLKSDDFFGVEKYPVSKLIITGSSKTNDGKSLVRGNLTIKAATHPVEFTAELSGSNDSYTCTAIITFDRSLYDVRFGSGRFFANLGDNAINDEIKLNVRLVLK
jgi:polyisoprenoid-binding protein YceI